MSTYIQTGILYNEGCSEAQTLGRSGITPWSEPGAWETSSMPVSVFRQP